MNQPPKSKTNRITQNNEERKLNHYSLSLYHKYGNKLRGTDRVLYEYLLTRAQLHPGPQCQRFAGQDQGNGSKVFH